MFARVFGMKCSFRLDCFVELSCVCAVVMYMWLCSGRLLCSAAVACMYVPLGRSVPHTEMDPMRCGYACV